MQRLPKTEAQPERAVLVRVAQGLPLHQRLTEARRQNHGEERHRGSRHGGQSEVFRRQQVGQDHEYREAGGVDIKRVHGRPENTLVGAARVTVGFGSAHVRKPFPRRRGLFDLAGKRSRAARPAQLAERRDQVGTIVVVDEGVPRGLHEAGPRLVVGRSIEIPQESQHGGFERLVERKTISTAFDEPPGRRIAPGEGDRSQESAFIDPVGNEPIGISTGIDVIDAPAEVDGSIDRGEVGRARVASAIPHSGTLGDRVLDLGHRQVFERRPSAEADLDLVAERIGQAAQGREAASTAQGSVPADHPRRPRRFRDRRRVVQRRRRDLVFEQEPAGPPPLYRREIAIDEV